MVARTTLEIEVDAARPASAVFGLAESEEEPPKRGQGPEGWQEDDWLPAGSAQLGIP